MFLRRILSTVKPHRRCFYLLQQSVKCNKFNDDNFKYKEDKDLKNTNSSLGEMSSKYKVFSDQDSEVILDIYEESNKYGDLLETQEDEDPFVGLNLERGVQGVYDIEDLVDVLKRENAQDIFVASVPKEIKYVDYICIVNGKSHRHMQAIAQFVRTVYKKKKDTGDPIPRLEGGNSKEWMALDLGNIALHIFSSEARSTYDLDSLWSVGSQFDDECNKEDPVAAMLEKHSVFLKDLKPAS